VSKCFLWIPGFSWISSIGGKSRMSKLTKEQRRALAKKAAAARWRRKPP